MGWLVVGGGEPWKAGLNKVSSIYTFRGPQLSLVVTPNVTKVAG